MGWSPASRGDGSCGILSGAELRTRSGATPDTARKGSGKHGGAPKDPLKGSCYFREVLPLAAPSQGTRRFTTTGPGTRELRTGPGDYGPYQPRSFQRDPRFPFWFEYWGVFRSMAGDTRELLISAVGAYMPEELSVWQLGEDLLRALQLGGHHPPHDIVFFDDVKGEPVGHNFFVEYLCTEGTNRIELRYVILTDVRRGDRSVLSGDWVCPGCSGCIQGEIQHKAASRATCPDCGTAPDGTPPEEGWKPELWRPSGRSIWEATRNVGTEARGASGPLAVHTAVLGGGGSLTGSYEGAESCVYPSAGDPSPRPQRSRGGRRGGAAQRAQRDGEAGRTPSSSGARGEDTPRAAQRSAAQLVCALGNGGKA